jgi:hypothetical protein
MDKKNRNSKELNSAELKYTDMDGAVDKTKLNIYKDGSNEDFLKLIKEFCNYIETYDIWQDEHAALTIYKNFCRCLAGAARDLWDQTNLIEDDQGRDELTFEEQFRELVSTVLGNSALCNQKEYLKKMSKPEKMTVKQWINRIKNINSYLPLMKQNAQAFTKEDLINEVITPNIPPALEKDFRLANLHLKTRIRDIIKPLTVIYEQVKIHPQNSTQQTKKNLKNTCKLHNGHHEWDDCHQNPKNSKTDGKKKNRIIAAEMTQTIMVALENIGALKEMNALETQHAVEAVQDLAVEKTTSIIVSIQLYAIKTILPLLAPKYY